MLDPQRRVLFLDTDGAKGREDDTDAGPCNTAEAELLIQIVTDMNKAAVPLKDICLVSPFRAQVLFTCLSWGCTCVHSKTCFSNFNCRACKVYAYDTRLIILFIRNNQPENVNLN